jgi:hypothetical protein
MAFDPADEIAAQIKREQEENNLDVDGSEDVVDIDKVAEKLTGNEPKLDEEIGFPDRQAKKDDENRANIPPEGSNVE